VVERLGPIESMSRSADLTTGHRWPILGVAFAWGLIVIVVTIAIAAAMQGTSSLATQLLTWIWQVLSGSFTAVYSAILYHDLRAVREGIGIDEIASVFD
jgi:pheromone shutdown protein TraB